MARVTFAKTEGLLCNKCVCYLLGGHLPMLKDWIASFLAMTNVGNPSLRVGYYEHQTVGNDDEYYVIARHEAIQSLNQRVTVLRHCEARSNPVSYKINTLKINLV